MSQARERMRPTSSQKLILWVGLFCLGIACRKTPAGTPTKIHQARSAAPSPSPPPQPVDRRPVDLIGAAQGSPDALVNIVEFSDFQCPFCAQATPTVARILKEYQGKVRFFFRHMPLEGIHPAAPLAAEAALAAGAQGKFWEMSEALFANQKALGRAALERIAGQLRLDLSKFSAALDARTFRSEVQKDIADGKKVGVRFTPVFFINGLPVGGAQPFEEFKLRIDQELEGARKLVASGMNGKDVYRHLMEDTRIPAPPPPAGSRELSGTAVYKVGVGTAPVRGGKVPKVTIIEFSDFQCQYCSRVQATLDRILKVYGNDVQLAFKHLPLPFHEHAAGAALAAEAAGRQGKFWEMHDELFANQNALDRTALEGYAKTLHLDLKKFWNAFDDTTLGARLDENAKEASRFGLTGTPSFFINGRLVRGALSFEAFLGVLDKEIANADTKLSSGVARKDLYATLTGKGLDKIAPTER